MSDSPLKIQSSRLFDRLWAGLNLDLTLQMLRGEPLWVGFCGCEKSIEAGIPAVSWQPEHDCPFCGRAVELQPMPPLEITITEDGRCRIDLVPLRRPAERETPTVPPPTLHPIDE
ncbi:MAG TPA: hypothetical protein G4O00_13635 [Thermoflexia bacterium]|nr:hypothetical protein [Thermoflexia bacterium]